MNRSLLKIILQPMKTVDKNITTCYLLKLPISYFLPISDGLPTGAIYTQHVISYLIEKPKLYSAYTNYKSMDKAIWLTFPTLKDRGSFRFHDTNKLKTTCTFVWYTCTILHRGLKALFYDRISDSGCESESTKFGTYHVILVSYLLTFLLDVEKSAHRVRPDHQYLAVIPFLLFTAQVSQTLCIQFCF